MITFYNGAKATVAVTLGISVFRIFWGSPALEGYVLHPLIVAAGMMHCIVHRRSRHG